MGLFEIALEGAVVLVGVRLGERARVGMRVFLGLTKAPKLNAGAGLKPLGAGLDCGFPAGVTLGWPGVEAGSASSVLSAEGSFSMLAIVGIMNGVAVGASEPEEPAAAS